MLSLLNVKTPSDVKLKLALSPGNSVLKPKLIASASGSEACKLIEEF